jgi:hypothetical protein
MKKTLIVLFTLFTFSALMAKKPAFQLTFGGGGGFTGLVTTYTLNSDRTFSKEESLNHKKEELPKVKAKEVRQIRKMLKKVNFTLVNIDKPGNMSSFITLKEGGKEYKSVWSGGKPENAELAALNDKLTSLIPHK